MLQRVWSWRDYATEEGELSWIPHFSDIWVHTSVVFGDIRNSLPINIQRLAYLRVWPPFPKYLKYSCNHVSLFENNCFFSNKDLTAQIEPNFVNINIQIVTYSLNY